METCDAPDSMEVDFPVCLEASFMIIKERETVPPPFPRRGSKAPPQIALKIRGGEQSGVAV